MSNMLYYDVFSDDKLYCGIFWQHTIRIISSFWCHTILMSVAFFNDLLYYGIFLHTILWHTFDNMLPRCSFPFLRCQGAVKRKLNFFTARTVDCMWSQKWTNHFHTVGASIFCMCYYKHLDLAPSSHPPHPALLPPSLSFLSPSSAHSCTLTL